MKKLALLAALLLLPACDLLNTTTVNNNQNGGGGSTGPTSPCQGVVSTINLDIESGVSSGQSVVGDVVTLSADPRGADGKTVPSSCITGAVTPNVTGSCTLAGPATLAQITVVGQSPGSCSVSVTFAGVGSNTQAWKVVP